jgi:hypothetical protein
MIYLILIKGISMTYRRTHRKGIGLIIVIIIMLLAAVALAGMAAYIQNASALTSVRLMRQQALFASMNGIALDLFGSSNVPEYGKFRDTGPAGGFANLKFKSVMDRDLIRIDASRPYISFTGDYWQISNVYLYSYFDTYTRQVPTTSVTINKVKIEWYETGNTNSLKGIQWVVKDGSGIVYSTTSQEGTYSSGEVVNLQTPVTIRDYCKFAYLTLSFQDRVPTSAIVIATFYFDTPPPNTRKAVLLYRGYSGNNEYCVTATGIAYGKYKRTLMATYDVATFVSTS